MKRRFTKFWVLAMIGYAVVVLLLGSGMIYTASRFDDIATAHVHRIRIEENQITLVERLRWSAEAIVSSGRGYLISREATFLTRLGEAQSSFDRGIVALIAVVADAPSNALVTTVRADAAQFREHQDVLVAAIKTGDARMLAHRFETELVPLQRQLGVSLDRLIDYKEAALDGVYDRVTDERARLRARLNSLVGILIVASLCIAAYVATLLGSSYRKEQEAVAVSSRAIAARDEIMALVAHDLRNPLTAIAMRAELLGAKADSEDVKIHAQSIVSVSQTMDYLIRSMLDVTTIESGRFTVIPQSCDAVSLLEETIDRFGTVATRKQIALDRWTSPEVPDVRADRERILQVLSNLVGNAIKFTPQGGRVEMSAAPDELGVRFRVSDTGPGIPPEHRAHVFDRFWKHETSGKRGTGLGLFISKAIVEAHGGRIWVEDTQDRGATFAFTLPRADALRQRGGPGERGDRAAHSTEMMPLTMSMPQA